MQSRTVARSSITSHRQHRAARQNWAALFDTLLDLKKDQVQEVETRDEKHAVNVRYHLKHIAKKEGMQLGWDRNADHTRLYLWLERGKQA